MRPNWTDQGAAVNVESALHPGAQQEREHVLLTTYKTPPSGTDHVGVVISRQIDGPTANRMKLNSPDTAGRRDNLIRWKGEFSGRAKLDAKAKNRLKVFASFFRRLRSPSSGGPTVVFHVGGKTEAEAKSRYTHLLDVVTRSGGATFTSWAQFTYSGPETNGYELVVGNGVAQVPSEHEAAHMFGLGDEYVGGGSWFRWWPRHNSLVRAMGLDDVVFENNDGIASVGTVVRPQHYSTFHWALGELTGLQWALGPPVPVTAPGPTMGDHPVPSGETTAA
jgi:hypothetical protein